MASVFIAGTDHGIGQALAHTYLDEGYTVYATTEHEDKSLIARTGYFSLPVDMGAPETVFDPVKDFTRRHTFDHVVLCSEMIGQISDPTDLLLHELQKLLDVNFLSMKQILDAILIHAKAQQVVLIGTDTTRLMQRGWGSYIATREVLNTLLPFYAEEFPDTHFSTIIPNLTATSELARIFKTADTRRFPSIARIQGGLIKPPEQTAEDLIIGVKRVRDFRSGERYILDELLKQ